MLNLRGEVILVGQEGSAWASFRKRLSDCKNLRVERVEDPENYTWYEPERSHRLAFIAISNQPSDTVTAPAICAHLQQSACVALLSPEPCLDIEQAALEAGLDGAFSHQDSTQQIIKGVGAIFAGETWYRRCVLKKKIDHFLAEQQCQPEPDREMESIYSNLLSPRELAVLEALVEGGSYKHIAEQLFISPHTVKSHVYKIFKKMKVNSRAQAACLFRDESNKHALLRCDDLQCTHRKTPPR